MLLLPTARADLLSARKWGAVPTAVLLQKESSWTYGGLFNHICSFASDSDRSTFVQPFLAYTTKNAFGLNTESTYDWNAKQWLVPINASVAKLVRFGKQPVSLGLNARYWAESPDSAQRLGCALHSDFSVPQVAANASIDGERLKRSSL